MSMQRNSRVGRRFQDCLTWILKLIALILQILAALAAWKKRIPAFVAS